MMLGVVVAVVLGGWLMAALSGPEPVIGARVGRD
jgi:hypothetical protein